MVSNSGASITELLKAWQAGDQSALESLAALVYPKLRGLARRHLYRAGAPEFQSSDLIHEAYLRLAEVQGMDWKDRAHFYAVAARVMRRVLVDAARARRSQKRFGRLQRAGASGEIQLEQMPGKGPEWNEEVIAVHEALERLEAVGPRQAQVVEMRYFGGLSVEEAAVVLGVSPQTVKRDWQLARAWLRRELGPPTAD